MSKSKGNVIDPWTIFDRFGADALRWYFFSAGQPWSPRRVSEDGIREATRQTLVTLWNVFAFHCTYADLDGWVPDGTDPQPTHVLDRWILSELDDTIADVTTALEDFDALGSSTRLARFIDDLSNWYVRRSRPRFWKASDPAAHATLHHVLVRTSELLAPFCPFVADDLHTVLTGSTSVHLADWPEPGGWRDDGLADAMTAARRLVVLGRSARSEAKVRTRQPLSRALLLHPGSTLTDDVLGEIATELNVKALEDVDTLSGLLSWTVIPNFRALGPRLGPRVNEIKQALADADGSALQRQLEAEGWVEIAGERLSADEVEVRAVRHESFALAEDSGWAVALDLTLTDDLRAEGLARELVRAVNDLRKEQGFEIADRIQVVLAGDPAIADVVAVHGDWIAGEVLATALEAGGTANGTGASLDLDGLAVEVTLTRA
jgi:isoleucyl-tRNA synthetase